MSQDIAAASGTPDTVVEPTTVKPIYSLGSRLAAEVFGTFLLVLGIVGAATFNALNQGSIIPVALAGGIALLAGVAAVGRVSGGHFNPAVTLGMVLSGRTPWRDLAPYWLAQLVGAALAAIVLWALIPSSLPQALGREDRAGMMQATANGYGEHSPLATLSQGQTEFTVWAALLIEVVIAAIFVGVLLGTTDRRSRHPYSPVVAGLTLTALIIVSWPVTNTGLNPARSFASALFGGGWTWSQLWLFVVAPLVGAALAALFYRAFAPASVEGYEVTETVEDADADADEIAPAGDDDVEREAEPGATTTTTEPSRGTVVIDEPGRSRGDDEGTQAPRA